MEKIYVAPGIYWINAEEADIRLLCGTPMDAIKHLKQRGLVRSLEKEGILYETGPNAILLSDSAMQGGNFCNLSEFPILHMIFKQGMAMKGHPNFSEYKPLIVGSESQVEAQKKYIFMGSVGLSSYEMLKDAGLPKDKLDDHWRSKMLFNRGKLPDPDEMVDSLSLYKQEVEIRNELWIQRTSPNVFRLRYKEQELTVDLNLKEDQSYCSPFYLNFHKIKREYFSVIHSGEGNGWDHERPCMGAVITYLGKYYLIDTGPNITDILTSLGICLNQIEGIFHTHAHDDHFAGLTSLMQGSHRIKYYAAKAVRMTVQKKMAALLGRDERIFQEIFDIKDLEIDQWNNIEGLEVLPLLSPHPLETTIFYFRTMGSQGYRCYGHLADIVTKSTLKSFTQQSNPISQGFYDQVWRDYLIKADIKKIDTGLGFVHGRAEDFKEDKSGKILLSHKDSALSPQEKEIGSNASFGQQDVLIPALDNFDVYYARQQLRQNFPDCPDEDMQLLMNNPLVTFSPGCIILKNGIVPHSVFLITSGFTEYISTEDNVSITLTAGSLIGEMPSLLKAPLRGTYRSACYLKAIEIPSSLYGWVIRKNNFYANIKLMHQRRSFIYNSPILGPNLSYPLQSKIARAMELEHWKKGERRILDPQEKYLYIIQNGKVDLQISDQVCITLGNEEPLGIAATLSLLQEDDKKTVEAETVEDSRVYAIPSRIISQSPYLQWTLLGIYEDRISMSGISISK